MSCLFWLVSLIMVTMPISASLPLILDHLYFLSVLAVFALPAAAYPSTRLPLCASTAKFACPVIRLYIQILT
jgi:hypothetical protein